MLSLAGSSERPQPTAPRTLYSDPFNANGHAVPKSTDQQKQIRHQRFTYLAFSDGRGPSPSSLRPVSLNSPDRSPRRSGLLSVFFNADPESEHSASREKCRLCANSEHWPHKEKDRRAAVSLKCDQVFRSGGLLILRLRRFPNHQLKLMMTSITSKNTNLCVFARLNLK